MLRAVAALVMILCLGACHDIRRMRRSRDVEGLIQVLTQGEPGERMMAADALASVGDSRGLEPLIRALEDSDPYVREHAARNLGCDYHSSLGCDREEGVRELLGVLHDGDPFVRVEAARSLGERGAMQARVALERLAREDARPEVRQAAAFALGRLGAPESIPVLRELLNDASSQVVAQSQDALRRVGTLTRFRVTTVEGETGTIKVVIDPESEGADGGPAEARDAAPTD